jgi:hypothetical protein
MRKGIARMIEAVISAILIIGAFSVSYYLLTPPSPSHIRSGESLSKIGYNILSTLASANGFEMLFASAKGARIVDWEQQLKSTINSLLPANVIFNVTVYRVPEAKLEGHGKDSYFNASYFTPMQKLNRIDISNVVDPQAFIRAGETAQIIYTYTMKNMTILVFNMRLADLGGT